MGFCSSVERGYKESKPRWRGKRIEAIRASLAVKQCNVCAICGKSETAKSPTDKSVRRLAMDHSHKTDVIRGLLCNRCNTGLGMFSDSAERLLKAADYLKRSESQLCR